MQRPGDFALIVIWQSFVVAAYRLFFQRLAIRKPSSQVTLVSPDEFSELGFQQIKAEPFADSFISLPNTKGHILPVFAPHTQMVFYRGLRRVFQQFKMSNDNGLPKVVVSISEPYSFTSFWVWMWARLCLGSRFVFVLYAAQNIQKKFSLPIRLVQAFMFRQADAVLVLGLEQEKLLRNLGYQGQTLPFPLWFDSEKFFPARDYRPRTELRLGFAGVLNDQKGILELLKAVKGLPAELAVTLQIVGDGPLRSVVERECENLSATGRKCSILGALPLQKMPGFYNSIDVLIVPSKTKANVKEQFGRVIIEAMACGCLVIGSDSGEIAKIIGNQDRIFKEGDVPDLTRAIEDMVALKSDAGEWNKSLAKCSAAAELYSDTYLSEKFARNIEKLISN